MTSCVPLDDYIISLLKGMSIAFVTFFDNNFR
nr:MAG TPA: hypothetical protein [Bacteriophage sp.]